MEYYLEAQLNGADYLLPLAQQLHGRLPQCQWQPVALTIFALAPYGQFSPVTTT